MKTGFILSFSVLIFWQISAQQLIQKQAKARLPSPRHSPGIIYDGNDFIYIFGGRALGEVGLNQILKYQISTDIMEILNATLPPLNNLENQPVVSINSDGIFHIFHSLQTLEITEFNPVTQETKLVANFTELFPRYSPIIQVSVDKVVMLGEYLSSFEGSIVEIDLKTLEYQVSPDEFEPGVIFHTGAVDKENGILYHSAQFPNGQNTILKYDVKTGQAEVVLDILNHFAPSGSTWINGKMFTIDGLNGGEEEERVSVFDALGNTYKFLPVLGMNSTLEFLNERGIVYVEKLDRIYCIGGYEYQGLIYKDQIWYIETTF